MAEEEPKKDEGAEVEDPELDKLLEEVSSPLPTKEAPADESAGKIDELLDEAPDPLPTATAPVAVSGDSGQGTVVVESPQEMDGDIRVILRKFHEAADRIAENYENDRDEIEDTIDRLRTIFSTRPDPKGYIVEGLVSALKTKADTNANFIKLLDAYAKFVAATKNTNVFQSTTTTIDIGDLLDRDDEE